MPRKSKVVLPTYPADWVISDEVVLNGRTVVKHTELSIRGERGRFRFVKHVKTPTSEWVDVWGGVKNAPAMRSFTLDRVKTVHRIDKTAENLLKARKAAQK